MKTLLVLFTTLFTSHIFAQREIKISEVNDHVGETVKIYGKISEGIKQKARNGPVTVLKIANSSMKIVIPTAVSRKFKTAPEKYYKDKPVCVIGRIKLEKGQPLILLADPNQIFEMLFDTAPSEPE